MARTFGTKIYSPDELYDEFEAYKEYCKNNPEKQEVSHPKQGTVIIKHERPYLEFDFVDFAEIHWGTWNNYKSGKGSYKDYFKVTTRILNEITSQKVRGGLVGKYNHNLVSRIEGLTDRQSHDHKVSVTQIKGMKIE